MIPIEFLTNLTNVKGKVILEKNGLSRPLVHPYVGQLCKFCQKLQENISEKKVRKFIP